LFGVALNEMNRAMASGHPRGVGDVFRIGSCFPDHSGQRISLGVARRCAGPQRDDLCFGQTAHAGESTGDTDDVEVHERGRSCEIYACCRPIGARAPASVLGLQLVYTSRPPVPPAVAVFVEFPLEKLGDAMTNPSQSHASQ